MRHTLLSVLALAAVVGLAVADEPPAEKKKAPVVKAKEEPSPLQPGKDLPGSFEPYNVTGPRKGFFHSLVDAYGLDPTVLILVRDLTVGNTPLRFGGGDAQDGLLKRLDDAIDRNPAARLHAFAVFLSPDLPNVAADDDMRARLAKALEDQAGALGLKHVVLSLDSPADLQKYLPGPGQWGTVVVYDRLQVQSVRPLAKTGDEGRKAVDEVMKDLTERLKLKGAPKAKAE
jgi:hypothetical protein